MSTTLKDIATIVGVDISTVSKVLQGAPIRVSTLTRDEILRVSRELNYRPNMVARGLRLKRSGAIAMPMPSTTNYLFPEIISGAEDAAEQLGFVLFLLKQSSVDPFGQLLSLIDQGRIDGLLFADEIPTGDFLDRLREREVSYVSLNRTCEADDRYVALDDEKGFECQARYLVSRGHTNVAFVRVTPSSFLSRLCEQAFSSGLDEGGARRPPCYRLQCDFGGEKCLELVDAIMGLSPRPTAVATASVIVAARLVEALRGAGIRVPQDISVIGYHDSPIAQWPPPGVTTVQMPSRSHGYRGVEALAQVIAGTGFAGEILDMPPKVVDRGTVASLLHP